MATRESPSLADWLNNCGGWRPVHDLGELCRGIKAGMLNEQDEYGMTALHLATASGWKEGVEELLRAGADTELRYFRTGETPLHTAVWEKMTEIITALVEAGADPDSANYWGLTPRAKLNLRGLPPLFDHILQKVVCLPPPLIQNAEHLADHYYPRFKIPEREERETLQVGQAVDLYVYGPKAETKQDTVKVRITAKQGNRPRVRYTAALETPVERTHLGAGTTEVEFGPENVATVYVPRPGKKSASSRTTRWKRD
jgi:hypothetical protein